MKRFTAYLLIICILCSLAGISVNAEGTAQNLLTGGDFESVSFEQIGDWTFKSYNKWYSGGTLETDGTNHYASVTGTGIGQNVAVSAGTAYRLTARVKTTGTVSLCIQNGDAAYPGSIPGETLASKEISNSEWQTVTVDYDGSAEASHLFVYLWSDDGITTYLDDVSLIENEQEYDGGGVVNGNFTDGINSWTKTGDGASVVDGVLSVSSETGTRVSQTVTGLTSGSYDLSVTAKTTDIDGAAYVYVKTAGHTTAKTAIPKTDTMTAVVVPQIAVNDGQCEVGVYAEGGATVTLDNFKLTKTADTRVEFLKGGEISKLTYVEDMGGKFYRTDGSEGDALQIMAENGFNLARIRLLDDPGKGHGEPDYYLPAGYMTESDCLNLARRAKDKGMKILFSFAYSDYWVDGEKQYMPHRWQEEITEKGLSGENMYKYLEDKTYSYTKDMMQKLIAQGTCPDYVSIGNEIQVGLYFGNQKTKDASFVSGLYNNADMLARFLNAGARAVRETSPETKIILHSDNGGKLSKRNTFKSALTKVGDNFDVIGVSYYPYYNSDVSIDTVVSEFNSLIKDYNKDVIIMETGYNWNMYKYGGEWKGQLEDSGYYQDIYGESQEGQRAFLTELYSKLKQVSGGRCIGDCYWDPIMIHDNAYKIGWAIRVSDDYTDTNVVSNSTIFDFTGKAVKGQLAMKYNTNSSDKLLISGNASNGGNPLEEKQLTFTVGGKKYSTKTDKFGDYIISVPYPDENTVTVSLAGSSEKTASVPADAFMLQSVDFTTYALTGISSDSELQTAITTGGDYEITADFSAANAGINISPSTGTISGNGHTITKSNSKWNDAILYQNCDGDWTFSDMTIDGNKTAGTFTDAALWYMAGKVCFQNATIQNFKTTKPVRYAINCNSTADMTLDSVTFTGNENANAAIDSPDVYIDGGKLTLSGTTKASIYCAGGSIDFSGLIAGSDIKITAATSGIYSALKAMTVPGGASVEITGPDFAPESLIYDFEDADAVNSMLNGGASVGKGKGISGNGLVLDGNDGYMLLPDNILSDNMTVMAWIKTDTVQSWARFFDFGSDTSNNFFYSPSGGRVESVSSRGKDTMDTEAFANTGIWEHYAVTRTAGKVQLYRNGALVSEKTCSYPVTAIAQGSNYIGKSHYATDKYFSGVMDDIKIYNKIMTAEELKMVYDEHAAELSASAAYKDYCDLSFATTELSDGAILPKTGANGSTVTWSCTDSAVIGANGNITAPRKGEADKRVTLTATVKNGDNEYTKTFKMTILAEPTLTKLTDYGMEDITMLDGYLLNGREKMYDYLKDFDIDKCVSGFRRTAGLSTTSNTYGGWETSLIAGHAIGHYTTALAQAYNDTGDKEILAKSNELIDKLYEAQIKEDKTINGQTVKKGYLFATTNAWSGGAVVSGEGQFDNVEANKTNITKQAWVPWYTMHKILAGLVDTYKLTGNEKALEMADALGTWVYNRVGGYNTTMQNRVLNIEYGGMNDVLYELYKITGDPNHARAAHMFDEISLFDEIYKGNDVLANKHANTTIPKIIGALNRVRAIDESEGRLLNDTPDQTHDREYYLTVAERFWDIVVNDHSYITGGNSENEHFRAPHTENAFRNEVNCETCNTYNMLKLSRELYKITGDKKYEDYYESTFLNAIVSSQNPETGMTMYFQPMATGYYKVFSTRWNDFWCCTGSGMESFTKLTDSIYYRKDNTIAVNQYISSKLSDKYNGIILSQSSTLPEGEKSTLTLSRAAEDNGWRMTAEADKTLNPPVLGSVTNNSGSQGEVIVYTAVYDSKGSLKSVLKTEKSIENGKSDIISESPSWADGDTVKLMLWDKGGEPLTPALNLTGEVDIALRIPEWAAEKPEIQLNGETVDYTQSGGYAVIKNDWGTGDTIEITMPMEIRAYGLYDSDTATAFKYGPTVLSVGLGANPSLTDTTHGMAVRKPAAKANINEYVVINPDYGTREEWLSNLSENMEKTDGSLKFTMKNTDQPLVFTPHYKRYDERYGIYWYVTGMTAEEQQAQILADKEAGRDKNIIIDSVEPSHDQQENGHGYTQDKSTGVEGTSSMPNYRLIQSGGYADYQMAVKKDAKNYLAVTYHSTDSGKQMTIYAGDTKIADVTASGKDETVKYEIPDTVLQNTFKATADTIKDKDALHITFRADKGTDAPKICGEIQILTDYGTDASLAGLTFDTGTLSPSFSGSVTSYTLTVPAGTENVSLTAVLTEQYGLVYVNDTLINDAAPKTVEVTTEPLIIKAFAEDHETAVTYTISFDNGE